VSHSWKAIGLTSLHPEAGDAQLLDYRVWQAPHIQHLFIFLFLFLFLFFD
jgi:hypothetical protein